MDLFDIDLRMLAALRVLLAEGHVTRAAERLGMPQPRLSNILARLRQITHDPLFVRTSSGMQATEFALELCQNASEFLDRFQDITSSKVAFDAAHSTRGFSIMASDVVLFHYLSRFNGRLRQAAPGISVTVYMPATNEIISKLQDGEADVAIFPQRLVPEYLYTTRFAEMPRVVIASREHPVIQGALSLEQYLSAFHVVPTFGPSYQLMNSEEMIENALSELGRSRKVALYTQGVIGLPQIVAQSDLLAVVPEIVASSLVDAPGIRSFPIPFRYEAPDLSLIWHERNHHDEGHRWLRTALKSWCFV